MNTNTEQDPKSPMEIKEAELAYEILDFVDMEQGKGCWFNHVILSGIPREVLSRLTDAPDWDSKKMRVTIHINEERVLRLPFETIINYFSNRLAEQRMSAAYFPQFEKAVQVAAKAMLDRTSSGMNDKFYELQQQLQHLTEMTASVVEREWAAPYKFQMTDQMLRAGKNALARFFDTDPDVNFEGKSAESAESAAAHSKEAVEAIYRAIVAANENPHYEVKLPLLSAEPQTEQEAKIRAQVHKEFREQLEAQGIVIDQKNAWNPEKEKQE